MSSPKHKYHLSTYCTPSSERGASNMKPTPPHTMTPNPVGSGRGHPTPKEVPRSFDHLQKNDRAAIRTTINNLTRAPKWKQMTSNDRRAGIRKAINEKIEQRDRNGNTRTARKEYPEEWDLEGEMRYFLHMYANLITMPAN